MPVQKLTNSRPRGKVVIDNEDSGWHLSLQTASHGGLGLLSGHFIVTQRACLYNKVELVCPGDQVFPLSSLRPSFPILGFPTKKAIGSIYTPGVLIVDDHEVTRTTVRSLLKYHSLPVCGEAEDGKQAIERVRELAPDVVLLDIEMPVMNGIQAAYEIRQISPSTKILFFTIHRNDAICSARVLGAEGFVAKPDAATELIPALERLLKVC